MDISIQKAQELVDQWIKTTGVRYFDEMTNLAILTEEVGEVARIMARKYGEQSFKDGETDTLDDELADVMWVIFAIANQTGINLTEAFERNMAKKSTRDIDRHKNNAKLKN